MAMSCKKRLQGSIYYLLRHNKMGSYSTQYMRRSVLFQAAETLVAGGYKLPHINGLKQKHVYFLVQQWNAEDLSTGTLKNRLAHVRAIADLIGKPDVVPSNEELGLPHRVYVTNQDKTERVKDGDMNKISDYRVKVQLNLQRVFGLRHEESLKIKPYIADKTDHLFLEGSWCKGGRQRNIPIRTEEQRYWLNEAKTIAENAARSLIPDDRKYIEYSRYFHRVIRAAGYKGSHGLRHQYAQERYLELAGWACPVKGGPSSQELTDEQKKTDQLVRHIITEEMGHSRIAILKIYCG